jgi:hypothetical protein
MPKQPRPLPDLAELQRLFTYDPETGAIYAKVSATTRKAGSLCNSSDANGYKVVFCKGRHIKAHRLAWVFFYGVQPDGYVDHINGDRSDNRIANLRCATHPQNMCNRPAPPHNTSGVKGVHHRKDNGKWRAYISVDRKRVGLGQFETKEEAEEAVKLARKQWHGEFAHD